MKITLRAKFHDEKGLKVSISKIPVQVLQPETIRENIIDVLNGINCPNCLARILDAAIYHHPETDIEETPQGYKAKLVKYI